MKYTTLEYIMWLCMCVIIGGVLIFIYWLFEPVHIIDAKSPFPLVKHEYSNGDTLEYVSDYCKFSYDIPTSVRRQLVDGYAIDLPQSVNSNFPKGCNKVTVPVPLVLPAVVHPGKYHILIYATYQINPLKTYTYVWQTEDFNLK